MKSFFFISTLTIAACIGSVSLIAQKKTGSRPNVLVIVTDDQSFGTIRALGNKEIFTPNMDKLVQNGTAFTQAYIMGGLSGAICCPSRAMLLSGKTIFNLHKDGTYIPESDITFPELLRANGYTTFETGKWHQDKATFSRSFMNADNILFNGMNPPEIGGQYRPKLSHFDSTGTYEDSFWGDHFSSIYFADAAVQFLDQQKNTSDPFLMYVAFASPHDPRTAPTWYGHSYRPEDVSLPVNYLPEHPFDNGELIIRDETLLPFPRTKEAIKIELANYYSMISEVDYQIGRILQELKKTGKDKNTIIVFASDNGLNVGQHGLLGKQNPYECSIRVPLIFSGPGIPQGKLINQYVYLNDVYPTICDLVGLKTPAHIETNSLADAFTKNGFKGRDKVFFAYLNIQRAIVRDGFKLVCYNVKGQMRTQLFDLNKDPYEMNDLSGNKAYLERKSTLRKLLSSTMKELNDFCDLDEPGWGHPVKWTTKEVHTLRP